MNLSPPELSSLVCACAAAVPALLFPADPAAQTEADAAVQSLIAKLDAARGKPPESLVVEGTVAVTFEGVPSEGFVLSGTARETFSGANRAKSRADLGELGGVMESGIVDDLVWEVDPVCGARVHTGQTAATVRRFTALLRGASPSGLYGRIARLGNQELDGREHVVLGMSASDGKTDKWYLDAQSGLVTRIDATVPVSEGAHLVWGMPEEIEVQLTFSDWKKVGGFQYPHRRAMKMGPATFTTTATRVETDVLPDPASFTPPDSVLAIKRQPAAQPADPSAPYQIVEREAQPVASIRVKCKPDEISATLAVVLPEVITHLNASGAKMMGVPFSRYHDLGGAEIDLEAGIPVAKPITEKGRVKNSELPAGTAVMAWHIGPYEKLPEAHKALQG